METHITFIKTINSQKFARGIYYCFYAKWSPVLALIITTKNKPCASQLKEKKLLCHCLLIFVSVNFTSSQFEDYVNPSV